MLNKEKTAASNIARVATPIRGWFALPIVGMILYTTILPAHAFDPHYVISDRLMTSLGEMTQSDVQRFLVEQKSPLSRWSGPDIDGKNKSAAAIIYRSGVTFHINPQVLLVLLQKEQGLVLDANPSRAQLDWATGYALCDNCRSRDPRLQKYKGFARQVHYAAKQLREYLDHPNQFRVQALKPVRIDGQLILPSSKATAGLYNYTPHLHGNTIFWALWQRWFSQEYPDGTLLRAAGDSTVWLVERNTRKAMYSLAVLESRFSGHPILTVKTDTLKKYPIGVAIRFPNYSVVSDPKGNIYLLADAERRHIVSEDVLRAVGFQPETIEPISQKEISSYRLGTDITFASLYPTGELLQSPDGTIYFVQAGTKYTLNQTVQAIEFPDRTARLTTTEELNRFTNGPSKPLSDGVLIKSVSHPRVFVMENGRRRPIASEKVFITLGYQWNDIHDTPNDFLQAISEGTIVDAPTPDIPLKDSRLEKILRQ